jgi:hypothetical protein
MSESDQIALVGTAIENQDFGDGIGKWINILRY